MKYIKYEEMKSFYTINEICRLLEMDKQSLKAECKKKDIYPMEDQYGNWGLPKKMLSKLHYLLYREERNNHQPGKNYYNSNARRNDPWA